MNEEKHNFSKRDILVDILKIVSMFMVIILHATSYGIKNMEVDLFSKQYWVIQILQTFSNVAVNCFILICGYYLSVREVKYQKLIHLWIQVVTFSVGVYLVLCVCPASAVSFSLETLIKQSLPLLTHQYWFVTVYFLLTLVAPMLNRMINNISQKEFESILCVLLITFSLIPSINIFGDCFGTNKGYSLLWFCILYLIAAYIRKFPYSNHSYGKIYVGISGISLGFQVCCDYLEQRIAIIGAFGNLAKGYNHVFVVLASVSLFLFALNKKVNLEEKSSKMIAKISSLSLGVYLLHENSQFREVLWGKIVCYEQVANSFSRFLIYMLISIISIFICGIVLEAIRSFCYYNFIKIVKRYRYQKNIKSEKT